MPLKSFFLFIILTSTNLVFAQTDGANIEKHVSLGLWYGDYRRPFRHDFSDIYSDPGASTSLSKDQGNEALNRLPEHVLYQIYLLEQEMVY